MIYKIKGLDANGKWVELEQEFTTKGAALRVLCALEEMGAPSKLVAIKRK